MGMEIQVSNKIGIFLYIYNQNNFRRFYLTQVYICLKWLVPRDVFQGKIFIYRKLLTLHIRVNVDVCFE